MSYYAFHYFHSLSRCLLSFLALMSVGPRLAQSRLTVLQIRYCEIALPAIWPTGDLVCLTFESGWVLEPTSRTVNKVNGRTINLFSNWARDRSFLMSSNQHAFNSKTEQIDRNDSIDLLFTRHELTTLETGHIPPPYWSPPHCTLYLHCIECPLYGVNIQQAITGGVCFLSVVQWIPTTTLKSISYLHVQSSQREACNVFLLR